VVLRDEALWRSVAKPSSTLVHVQRFRNSTWKEVCRQHVAAKATRCANPISKALFQEYLVGITVTAFGGEELLAGLAEIAVDDQTGKYRWTIDNSEWPVLALLNSDLHADRVTSVASKTLAGASWNRRAYQGYGPGLCLEGMDIQMEVFLLRKADGKRLTLPPLTEKGHCVHDYDGLLESKPELGHTDMCSEDPVEDEDHFKSIELTGVLSWDLIHPVSNDSMYVSVDNADLWVGRQPRGRVHVKEVIVILSTEDRFDGKSHFGDSLCRLSSHHYEHLWV